MGIMRRSLAVFWLAVIGVLHRVVIFEVLRHDLVGFSAARPDWLTWQFYPLDVYARHFWAGMCLPPFFVTGDHGVPARIAAQDGVMNRALGGSDVARNMAGTRLIAAQYRKAVSRFTWHFPRLEVSRFATAYHVFWQRMADYGVMFIDPIYVVPHDRGIADLAARGFGERQMVMTGRGHSSFPPPPPQGTPIMLPTISLAPLDAVCILVLHGVFPLLAAIDIWRRLAKRAGVLPPGSWFLACSCAYGLVIFNAVDAGENMRFRLAVEPALIALTISTLAGAWHEGARLLARRRAFDSPG